MSSEGRKRTIERRRDGVSMEFDVKFLHSGRYVTCNIREG